VVYQASQKKFLKTQKEKLKIFFVELKLKPEQFSRKPRKKLKRSTS